MFVFPLRKELFWDIDVNVLDPERNKRLIIDRVLSIGNLSELKIIIQYYGKETIVSEIKQMGYLDPKTLEFVVSYFGIRKEELKCYIKKQLAPQHWN